MSQSNPLGNADRYGYPAYVYVHVFRLKTFKNEEQLLLQA
jgi:hypothetical protein